MDELVIGEKKYVSSKAAAKATGYAKDYVGQLCREGRVPARLVGRSWYVLESAIHDHRFGEPKEKTNEEDKGNDTPAVTPMSAWDAPRYTTVDAEVLPSVNRLRVEDSPPPVDGGESTQHPQDTWQAWFDRFEGIAQQIPTGITGEDSKKKEEEVAIPIHTIYDYQPPARFEEPIQHHQAEVWQEEESIQQREKGQKEIQRPGRVVVKTLKLAGVLVAVFMLATAVLGSGYLDTYIISSKTARAFAGVSVYQK